MLPNSYSYTVEKLTGALECLATHPGDARKRVAAVYSYVHMLNESDFPLDLRNDWNWVMQQIVRYGPLLHDDGTPFRDAVENTRLRTKNSTAAAITKRLYNLYWSVSQNELYR